MRKIITVLVAICTSALVAGSAFVGNTSNKVPPCEYKIMCVGGKYPGGPDCFAQGGYAKKVKICKGTAKKL